MLQASSIAERTASSIYYGNNAPFIEALYEIWLDNQFAVDEAWHEYFTQIAQSPGAVARDLPHSPVITAFTDLASRSAYEKANEQSTGVSDDKQIKVLQFITAYRFLGNRWARLDPLKRFDRPDIPELELAHYDLTELDKSRVFNVGSFLIGNGKQKATLHDLHEALKETYCGSIGAEYMYLSNTEEKRWIQSQLEPARGHGTYAAKDKLRFLERITAAETLERYLHTKYVGQKRFSLEGSESLILSLDETIRAAGVAGVQEIVIGMAHRGRINVLVNTLGKSPAVLFEEFEGKKKQSLSSGDVKYHMGYSSDVSTPGGPVHLTLAFNPSHLEIINPVIQGSVYARQQRHGESGKRDVLPVLVHGDSAVIGQGVNQEMLNFSQTRGYGCGGTVHIVVNNQIGFTVSDPRDYRSSWYCTDIFKMAEAPIFHVNGDDVEAVALVSKIALDYRNKYGKDVVIDIYCFRKLGHNEQDEPMVTQPLMYKKIALHPGVRKQYADQLIMEGSIDKDVPEKMIDEYREHMDDAKLLNNPAIPNYQNEHSQDWHPFIGNPYVETCDTTVPIKELNRLAKKLGSVPDGITQHPRVTKILNDRLKMGNGELQVDWGMAENLAYATLLVSGYGVRLSGEDVGRGTFSHRHAVVHHQDRLHWSGGSHCALACLQETQGRFQVYDSVLSEEAVLAFEYGYATAEPKQLILWEAQFGDFANGAQVVIDQFISSGEAKWGRSCGLVLLLPHGYEGQGPEHSSARLERYMQLSADFNWEVCVPTNSAQIFHLLRRQMLRKQRKPLVVMTPKSLLRAAGAASSLDELASGTFQTIIPESQELDNKKITRVVACAGKVYYDLIAGRKERNINNVAILRVEQLYPFDDRRFEKELLKYPGLKEIVWCQEEPLNQGSWYAKAHRLQHAAWFSNSSLRVVARPASASPAVGYYSLHNQQQKLIVEEALGEIKQTR